MENRDDEKIFDVTERIKSGLKTTLGEGATSATASLLGYGLNSLLGTDLGGSAKTSEIINDLNLLLASMEVVQQEVEETHNAVVQLANVTALNGIASGTATSIGTISDLWTSLTGYIQQGEASESEIRAFYEEGVGLSEAITTIMDTMVTNSQERQGLRGQIDIWVDSVIDNISSEEFTSDVGWSAYKYLEAFLVSQLQFIYQAMIIQVNWSVLNQCLDGNSIDSNCLVNSVGQDGIDYIDIHFYPLLAKITQQYRSSIYRFVLSCYHPETATDQPTFLSEEQCTEILARSELICWLSTLGQDDRSTLAKGPGAIVRSLQLPSTGHTTLAAVGFPTQASSRVQNPLGYDDGKFMANWYKCVDFTDSRNYEMRTFADSDILTYEFAWPWPSSGGPTAGQKITPTGPYSPRGWVANYYDIRTLEIVSEVSDWTVLMAPCFDIQDIMWSPLFTNSISGNDGGWTTVSGTADLDGRPHTLTLDHPDDGDEVSVFRKFSYDSDDRKINLRINASTTIEVEKDRAGAFLSLTIQRSYEGCSDGKHHKHNYYETNPDLAEDRNDLVPGIHSFTLKCHPKILFELWNEGSKVKEDVVVTVSINMLRLGWDQPLPDVVG